MSINFQNPMNAESFALMKKLFGEPAAKDDLTLLYDKLPTINSKDMSAVARAAKQPVTVEAHGPGDIKTMADGTRYQVTPTGWVKLP